jgi:putative ABC transport system substrate-binding protein
MISRRAFIAGLGVVATMPSAARCQQGGSMRRVGVLMAGTAADAAGQSRLKAFIDTLGKAGWVEGKNLRIDIRYNAADAELSRIYAAQLIGLMPNVIFAQTTMNLTSRQLPQSRAPGGFGHQDRRGCHNVGAPGFRRWGPSFASPRSKHACEPQ